MNPVTYGGGALVTSQLAITLGILFPMWTAVQAGAVAGLTVAAIGAAHMAIRAYFPPPSNLP